jgi:Leucine-rich repeat (LRR) protein
MAFAFQDCRFLVYLILSENEIELVDSRAFHGLAELRNIDLSYNNLNYIAPVIFSETPLLETVSFRGNPLAYFPESPPILASPSITSLDLSSCTLTSVNADTFSQLPNLRNLNLNSNRLHEFNLDILNTLRELSNVDLGNNMWKCDCNIVQVLSLLSKKRQCSGLDGGHKQVKCFEAGEYKTIWNATSKNESCTEQSGKFAEKITSTGPTTIIGSTEKLPTIMQMNELKQHISTLESGKNEVLNNHERLLYIIMTMQFAIFLLLATVAANIITNSIRNFRGKVNEYSKTHVFSNSNSADDSKEDHVFDHTYEEIK